MLLTLLYNLKPIIAHKINQPLTGNILKIMRPRDPEPAAGDPSADGFVLVAEDGFHILGGYDVGQVVPLIVKPRSEVFGNLIRVKKVLISRPLARLICGKGYGDKILFRMLGAVLYICVEVGTQDDVAARFLARVLAGDHSVLKHPRALALTDM